MTAKENKERGRVTVNKKAYHNYEIVEKIEAGLALLGSEVKSLRTSQADLSGSYGRIEGQECQLVGATITPYDKSGATGHEPTRKRKLLLHKMEINSNSEDLRLCRCGFILIKGDLQR